MDVAPLKIDRQPKRARARRRGPGLGVVLLLVAAGAVWLFRAPLLGIVDRFRLPTVRTMRVAESHPATAGAAQGTAANGHIIAARRAALSADTPGRIVELNVTEGSIVAKGDVVARLYSLEYEAALRRAEAEVASARAAVGRSQSSITSAKAELVERERAQESAVALVSEARANRTLAQENFDRAADLVERGMRSQSDLDTARAAIEGANAVLKSVEARLAGAQAAITSAKSRISVSEADLAIANAQIEVLEAARAQAAATLSKTEVRAPFDGIVVLKDAEVGEVVSPNSQGGSNARGSVCTMVDLASLEVQAEVPEINLASVELGAPATIYLDAWPSLPYIGKVDRIWPTANRQKATIEVRIKFAEPDDRLRPEMGVRVVFGTAAESVARTDSVEREPVILVPQEAIVESSDSFGVFLLDRDVVRLHGVEIGERRSGRVAVKAGLTAGQRIVIDPPAALRDGDRVRIQEGS